MSREPRTISRPRGFWQRRQLRGRRDTRRRDTRRRNSRRRVEPSRRRATIPLDDEHVERSHSTSPDSLGQPRTSRHGRSPGPHPELSQFQPTREAPSHRPSSGAGFPHWNSAPDVPVRTASARVRLVPAYQHSKPSPGQQYNQRRKRLRPIPQHDSGIDRERSRDGCC